MAKAMMSYTTSRDTILILAFLWPDAHTKARDISTMQYLARLAKEWRDNN
ncbi:hypothetical protein PPUN110474_53630 [Pseudomonas putida]|nr:hypothetical protein PPUN110474_53630 [Pseudomonas putida]